MVSTKCNVVTSTEEEVHASSKLKQMNPVDGRNFISLARCPRKLKTKMKCYLSPSLIRCFLNALVADFNLRASPSFSVTIHSFTRPASNKPMKVALVRWSDITFSKRIQNTSRWSDLFSIQHKQDLSISSSNTKIVVLSYFIR